MNCLRPILPFQVAAKFFKSRAEGPKNLGKDPVTAQSAAAAPAPAASPKPATNGGAAPRGQLTEPVNYVVTYGGKSHQVTVAPAE